MEFTVIREFTKYQKVLLQQLKRYRYFLSSSRGLEKLPKISYRKDNFLHILNDLGNSVIVNVFLQIFNVLLYKLFHLIIDQIIS